jgi:hypothetical protein
MPDGYFNGKSLRQCEFTGKSLLCKDNQSYNGIRLLQFSEASELDIVNTFNCCDGFYTRILNDQRSAIDYVLMSKGLSTNVSSVLIDEKGVFDLNSDHVIISVKLREITQILKKQDSYSSIKHFWKFTDDTDWELFRCNLKDNFQDNWANVSNNVNDIWETWKYIVNTAAESVARKVPKVKNYKNIWDKGLDKILKRRQEVNRLQRLHNKHDHMMVN